LSEQRCCYSKKILFVAKPVFGLSCSSCCAWRPSTRQRHAACATPAASDVRASSLLSAQWRVRRTHGTRTISRSRPTRARSFPGPCLYWFFCQYPTTACTASTGFSANAPQQHVFALSRRVEGTEVTGLITSEECNPRIRVIVRDKACHGEEEEEEEEISRFSALNIGVV
jgi:hypothetical protein